MLTAEGFYMQAKLSNLVRFVLHFAISLVLLCTLQSTAEAAWPAPLSVPEGQSGMVAADVAEASAAGAEVLGQGGNAIDAAVATALALGVVGPSGSGLGGGGFALIYLAKERRVRVLDFREVAPRAATRDMFWVDGKIDPERSRHGGLAVAVPGEPAGLAELELRYGRLGLRRVAAPAVRLARFGFPASFALATGAKGSGTKLPSGNSLRTWLLPQGVPLEQGAWVRRPALAATIERFGREGRRDFYDGSTARAIIAAVNGAGGRFSREDLSEYEAIWRDPLVGHYRGHTFYAVPPPAGGLTALEALQILDALPPFAPDEMGASSTFHFVAEALKHAFADRARLLGDPAFFKVPIAELSSPAYARARAAKLSPNHVLPLTSYGRPGSGDAAEVAHDQGTSHLCAVDREGNVVALTTTVNLPFGAWLEAGSTGVLLNDEMDDFSAAPGRPNAFGLVGSDANAIAPGKRPQSSMTPLIVMQGDEPLLCVGGSGGPTIVASTVQTVVQAVDFHADAEQAVAAPRIYAQWLPEELFVEQEIPKDVIESLHRRGHKIAMHPKTPIAAQAIVLHGHRLEAASDPRKGGAPAAPSARRAAQ
jgi:gamma-glutamyltranspeptidase/glutathione hydrolase